MTLEAEAVYSGFIVAVSIRSTVTTPTLYMPPGIGAVA